MDDEVRLIGHKPVCPKCGKIGERDAEHDAYHCIDCDIWLEPTCGDQKCEFCFARPEKPSVVESKSNGKNILQQVWKSA